MNFPGFFPFFKIFQNKILGIGKGYFWIFSGILGNVSQISTYDNLLYSVNIILKTEVEAELEAGM